MTYFTTTNESLPGIIYKTQRANVIVEFDERPWLPNPLSLLYYLIIKPLKLLRRLVVIQIN